MKYITTLTRHTPLRFPNILLVFILVAIANCAVAQVRPDWIDNPGTGTVGSAPYHIWGRHAQEELAIARARTRLAARLGVEVNSVQHITEVVDNGQSGVSSTKQTTHKIKSKTVKADTKAMWHDKKRDIVYVWLIQVERSQ